MKPPFSSKITDVHIYFLGLGLCRGVYSAKLTLLGGLGKKMKNMLLGEKNENFFSIFLPSLMKKKINIMCGRGDNINT